MLFGVRRDYGFYQLANDSHADRRALGTPDDGVNASMVAPPGQDPSPR